METRDTPSPDATRAVLAPVRRTFRALAATFVPEAEGLDDEGWATVEAIVEDAVRARPPSMRRQLGMLIRLLDWLPVLRWGRRFRSLDPDRRARFLAVVQDAPLLLLRRGIWGLRTLVFMGYYARPGAGREIGYRAHPRGWQRTPSDEASDRPATRRGAR